MLTNHIKVILRSLSRSKSYTFLNILGLTSGLVVFILITLYTSYEFSYDGYHEKADRIFRIYKEEVGNSYLGSNKGAVTPGPLAEALKTEFPEVTHTARFRAYSNTIVKANDEIFVQPDLFMVDPDVFKVFSFESVAGDIDDFLSERNSAAISESVALKYFGRTDVLGEIIHFRNEHPVVVSGVFRDMPENSHFVVKVAMHFEGTIEYLKWNSTSWGRNSYHTFLLLESGSSPKQLQEKLPLLRAKYANDPIDEDGQETQYTLQSLTDVHFTQNINFDIAPSTSSQKLYIYLGIAFMVLIIAGINYVNLATTRAINRTKEIGIRKVVGAQSRSLIFQFLMESFVLVFVSLLIALVVLFFALPAFAEFVDRPLALDFTSPERWLFLIGLSLGLSILAGLYPSWVLTSFKPVAALKGKGEIRQQGSLFRNGLVVFQFVISSGLIIAAVVLVQQLNYIQNTNMGFVRDQIVKVTLKDKKLQDKIDVFNEEVRKIPGVTYVAGSSSMPNKIDSRTSARWPGMEKELRVSIYTAWVGYDFFDLFEMKFVAGRSFNREKESDKKATILNQAAIDAFGWTDDPIGRQYITQSGDTGRVVGVLKDFNQHSMHLAIEPVQFFLHETLSRVSVKMEGQDFKGQIAAIEEIYNSYEPAFPFEYNYFDEIFNEAYESEMKTAQLAKWFTFLTIIIACLGLYGLATHKVQQRIKEVGVRKVLGASVPVILGLLSKDFVKLLIIAFLIAAPIAYYVMDGWLDGFAYHVNIGPFTLFITLFMMIVVAGATVGYRTYRAAVRNPIEALREE